MPLDARLAQRYKELFNLYGTGGNELMLSAKRIVTERRNILRDDAAYLLLVNLDHMIIQPLCGYIPQPNGEGQAIPTFRGPNEVTLMVQKATNIIINALHQEEMPQDRYSANAIIRAIAAAADEIGEAVAWW